MTQHGARVTPWGRKKKRLRDPPADLNECRAAGLKVSQGQKEWKKKIGKGGLRMACLLEQLDMKTYFGQTIWHSV